MSNGAGRRLIEQLLAEPEVFDRNGTAIVLLQEYFGGLPLESLRPLLAHQNSLVRQSAAFITAELGPDAGILVADVVPLASDPDPHTQYHACEVLTVCATGDKADSYVHILHGLESVHKGVRLLVMHLVSRADEIQLGAAIKLCSVLGTLREIHQKGLTILAESASSRFVSIAEMLAAPIPLMRLYGAIAAKRALNWAPELLQEARFNSNAEVKLFAEQSLDNYRFDRRL